MAQPMLVQVFLVDKGTMYHVQANVAHPVSCLHDEIERVSKIPADKQVLLMSGGVALFPDKSLGHYESILDNPLYLICTSPVTEILRPAGGGHVHSDQELTSQVESSAHLPPTMEAVGARTQLAARLCQVDKGELKMIEELVYDQHLQQQGWAAVVANLEDLLSGFEKRAAALLLQFQEFLKVREDILALIRRMPEVLVLMEKVPVLPCLEMSACRTSVSLKAPLDVLPSFSPPGRLTLYSWMNTQDHKHRLEDVIRDLSNGTSQMREEVEERVAREVSEILGQASGPKYANMKSIKGLEDRLYGLDRLLSSARATVESQINMARGFEQNKARLEAVKDSSILPDLCASHRKQMRDMLTNHRKLVELKRKCADAKKELSDNLRHRLSSWVMDSHRRVSDMDNRQVLYHDMLNRLRSRAQFLQQVERAPHVYAAMVVEVARRRLFSQHYLKWAGGVAEESRKEHRKEIQRRKSFTKQYGSHFLQKMFAGFKDNVPKFASEPPKDIDSLLPDISPADVENLARSVPELKSLLRVPRGTGSPAVSFTTQQPLAADGGSDPMMIEVTRSILSSTTSVMSVSRSVSEALDMQAELLEPLDFDPLASSYQCPAAETCIEDEFLSVQENFHIPQCLSETLTAEVNSAAMSTISVSVVSASPKSQELCCALQDLSQQQQTQDMGTGDIGPLFSSADLEPAKSSDSDAAISQNESLSDHQPVPCAKKRRGGSRSRVLPDTSPDEGETSAEFTTADFYIEDSMPSSITDSPPKPDSKERMKAVAEINAVLTLERKKVGELEREISVLQNKLLSSEEKLTSLRSLLSGDIGLLRDSLATLKDTVRRKDSEHSSAVSEVEVGIVSMLTALLQRVEEEKSECLGRGRVEGRKEAVEELQEQLTAKSRLVEDLHQASLKVTHGIADLTKELQQTRECYQREISSLKEKHEAELQDLSARLTQEAAALKQQLEVMRSQNESEMANLTVDLQQQRCKQDEDITSLQAAHQIELEELRSKNLLELELEMDRVRSELQNTMEQQEAELQQQVTTLQTQLHKLKLQHAEAAETMQQDFAKERKELHKIWEEEKQNSVKENAAAIRTEEQRRLETAVHEVRVKMEKELQQQVENERSRLEAELREERQRWEEELKSQKENLQAQHQLMVEERVNSVSKTWEVKLAEREAQHQLMVEERVNSVSKIWEVKLAEREAQLQQEMFTWQGRFAEQEEGHQRELLTLQARFVEQEEGQQHELQARLAQQESVLKQEFQYRVEPLMAEIERTAARMGSSVCEQACQYEGEGIVSVEQHEQQLTEAVREATEQIVLEYQMMLQTEREKRERCLAELEERYRGDMEAALHSLQTKLEAQAQAQQNDAVGHATQERDVIIQQLRQQLAVDDESDVDDGSHKSPSVHRELAELLDKETSLRMENQRLEGEVSMLQQQVRQYSEQFHAMTASAAPMLQSSLAEASLLTQSEKQQKQAELQEKLMATSMTASMRREVRDKVSILTCNVGDLVLLCLDERHGQYVVFTVNNTLHFLHNECLEPLGLTSVEGAPRKNWVLAEVTDREYCQARKPQNRFRVPVNTKFYRVKAKLWTPQSSSSSSTLSSSGPAPSSPT